MTLLCATPFTSDRTSMPFKTSVNTPTGSQVPLKALAQVRRDLGPNAIAREDGQRRIIVMANVADRDLSSVVHDIRDRLDARLELPSGYHILFGGQFESAERATRTLGILGFVVVIIVFFLLFMAFRSLRDASLGILSLPLSLMGGVVGVWLGGGVISVASLVGFITLRNLHEKWRHGHSVHHLAKHEG